MRVEAEEAATRAYGLDDYWLAIYRQRWIILLVIVASAALAWWLSGRIEPRYEASAAFYVPTDVSRSGTASETDEGRARLPGGNIGETKGHVALLQGGDAMRHIASEFGTSPSHLYRNVDFVASRQGIIKVYARDKDPDVAARLANRYVAYFNEFHIKATEEQLTRSLERLAAERRAVTDRQEERARQREAFGQENQITSLQAELVQLEARRDRYDEQLKLVDADVSAARQRLAVREQQLKEEEQSYEDGAVAIQSPLLDTLREQIVAAQADLAQKSVELQPTHPEVKSLEARVQTSREAFEHEVRRLLQSKSKLVGTRYEKLREDLAAAHADVAAAEARAQALRTGDGGVRERIAMIPALQRQWAEFDRQDARDQAELELLDREYGDTRLMNLRQRDVIVSVQEAFAPAQPVYPIPVLNAIIAAVAGAIVGIIYALLLEHIDHTSRQRRLRRLALNRWLDELTPGTELGVGETLGLDRKPTGNGWSGTKSNLTKKGGTSVVYDSVDDDPVDQSIGGHDHGNGNGNAGGGTGGAA